MNGKQQFQESGSFVGQGEREKMKLKKATQRTSGVLMLQVETPGGGSAVPIL